MADMPERIFALRKTLEKLGVLATWAMEEPSYKGELWMVDIGLYSSEGTTNFDGCWRRDRGFGLHPFDPHYGDMPVKWFDDPVDFAAALMGMMK